MTLSLHSQMYHQLDMGGEKYNKVSQASKKTQKYIKESQKHISNLYKCAVLLNEAVTECRITYAAIHMMSFFLLLWKGLRLFQQDNAKPHSVVKGTGCYTVLSAERTNKRMWNIMKG